MKLYYSAGSCSTACHITLEESGLPYQAIEVEWDKSTSSYNTAFVEKLNPLGTLPILMTDTGKQLDQNLAIHTYIAENAPHKKLLPPEGTIERAEAMNWLSFVATDLHKSIGGFFSIRAVSPEKSVQEVVRKFMLANANVYLNYMDSKLSGKDYLMGTNFTPADAYAFVVLGWTKVVEIPLTPYSNIRAYMERVAARPAVVKVWKDEGLV